MRLSREVTLLSRIVNATCWTEDENKINGHGSRTNTYSIHCLAKRDVLANLDSMWARTVRCDWAREDWRQDDGAEDSDRDQDTIDNIVFMAEQYLGGPKEHDDLDANADTHGLQVWIDALDFLSGIGVVDILKRQIVSVLPEEANRLGRTGRASPLSDPRTYPTIKARIVDFGHMDRRYPPKAAPDN